MGELSETLAVVLLFNGSTPPKGWYLCDGTVLNIANNEPLFSLLGSKYGGDGYKTFALPKLANIGTASYIICGEGNMYPSA